MRHGVLVCTVPLLSEKGNLDIKITLNRQQYSSKGMTLGTWGGYKQNAALSGTDALFFAHDTIKIQSAAPLSGPPWGGTSVTLNTNNLPVVIARAVKCRFGTNLVPAKFDCAAADEAQFLPCVGRSLETCSAPCKHRFICVSPVSSTEREADLALSSNDQQYSEAVKFAYQYPQPCYTCQYPSDAGRTPACVKNGTIWSGDACTVTAASSRNQGPSWLLHLGAASLASFALRAGNAL